MNIWTVFIFSLLAISGINAYRNIIKQKPELTLEDMRGLWVGDMASQFMTGYDLATGRPTQYICTNELYQECRTSLTPGRAYIEIGQPEEHDYHAFYYRFKSILILKQLFKFIYFQFIDSKNLDDCLKNYPVCNMEGIYPAYGPIETFAKLVSYEDQQLKYELQTGFVACMPWEIFVEDGIVKAYVEQKCNWEGNPLEVLYGTKIKLMFK